MLTNRLSDSLAYLRSDRFAAEIGARGWGLIGMSGVMLAMGAATAGMVAYRKLRWAAAEGSIDRCEAAEVRDRRGNRIAIWRLWYRYTFGGRQILASETVDAGVLRNVEAGQPIKVYLDRSEPTRSTSALGMQHAMLFARHVAATANGLAAAGVASLLPDILRTPAVEYGHHSLVPALARASRRG